MRSEFEKLKGISQYIGAGIHFNEELNRYRCTRIGMTATAEILDKCWSVYQHRQTEVDGLQKQLIDQGQRFNEQTQRVKDLEHKSGELQKRVNAALWLLKVYKDEMDHGFEVSKATVKKLEQALKGGES